MNDEFYIKRTLRLASKAKGLTSPNPMVGAVIVKNGEIIAEDFHRKPGAPHAEPLALEKAGKKVRGAVLYVNLEPCCHTDKRTPPCTKAIINSGIKRVVIGMLDPNPKVAGKGAMELQNAGIEVRSGILEDESKILNEFYVKHVTTGKPFVILKTAMTLDGKIATPEGQSKWITCEKARKIVLRLRSRVDAIMTAIGTVKSDDPQLTARVKIGKNPLRIVIDPHLEIPLNAKILKMPPQTIIVTNTRNLKSIYLEKSGINMLYYKEKLNLKWLMEQLGKMEISSVLIEGGSSLNSHALEDGVIDKIMFFIAPIIIGGRESFPAVGGKTYKRLEEAYRIKDLKIKRIGDDLLIEGYIR
ncbi:MAG: bifunctional diaminohydroxyphosphoribosylaminopyrimidine deaminase/5-amino-6-(5-phosphoribosylamino)uracil reductase RibD [Nitrospira sp.]|nr:bifunctional diaminohydroxyphosphoribosylaminopyrimidine deaminase/5-amino-6-(5-phosphoribosylamino)uracil reductase RibD [Nitrospira sp.]